MDTGRSVFLLDERKKRSRQLLVLGAEPVYSGSTIRDSLAHATKDSLWISYRPDLTRALLKQVSSSRQRTLGSGVFVHELTVETIAALRSWFSRLAFATGEGVLPPQELAEALAATNRRDLLIAGSVDHASRTVTFWRGDLRQITVPFSAFSKSGGGTEPDFDHFSVTDYGHTVRFGDYEAATDAILYEYDPEYRRLLAKKRRASERSFGASLRRLRIQRGLKREDFDDISAKTIARIEQGKVKLVRKATLDAIARRLNVEPEEIESY